MNSIITAWLKYYYPVEFYAAVLTIQDNEDKRVKYMETIEEQFGIKTVIPHINKSTIYFTPDPDSNEILFGLNNIKGVGDSALEAIIENQPYTSLEDFLTRLPKKVANKRVVMALIKAGAFDCFNKNRNALINEFYEIRKVKDEPLLEEDYNDKLSMEYESETLGTSLTVKPWFSTIPMNEAITFDARIISVQEKYDKNNRLMAFVKAETIMDNTTIELVIFSSAYSRYVNMFDMHDHQYLRISGKKTDKTKVIVNTVKESYPI